MKMEKVEKFVATLHDKTEHVTQTQNLKEVLKFRLVLTKVHKIIKFNQIA